MHVITNENADELYDAARDVVMMFVDIAEEGGRPSDSTIWIRFDPLKFVDAREDGRFNYGDVELVRTGAALAMLCDFYDNWEEGLALLDERTKRFAAAVREGRLAKFPDIANVVTEALAREVSGTLGPWFNDAVRSIYHRYVKSYFARLASAPDWRL